MTTMTHTTIIGLIGQAGSGKDTVAALLGERGWMYQIAFADHLKTEVIEAFDLPRTLLYTPELKEVPTEKLALRNCREAGYVAAYWGLANLAAVTPRSIMQTWGDWRSSQDPDYFITRVDGFLGALSR